MEFAGRQTAEDEAVTIEFKSIFPDKTRNERLADHYLEKSGIAGILVDDLSSVCSVRRTVTLALPMLFTPAVVRMVCTETWSSAMELARAQTLYPTMPIEQRAAMMGIGLSSHAEVIGRAIAAVDAVNEQIRHAQTSGGMRLPNSAFKAQRRLDPGLRYQEWLHRQKELIIETMAMEVRK